MIDMIKLGEELKDYLVANGALLHGQTKAGLYITRFFQGKDEEELSCPLCTLVKEGDYRAALDLHHGNRAKYWMENSTIASKMHHEQVLMNIKQSNHMWEVENENNELCTALDALIIYYDNTKQNAIARVIIDDARKTLEQVRKDTT